MTARYVRLDIDSEPIRLARDLRIFIQRAAARPLGKARTNVSSTDGILAPVASFAVNRLRQELRGMKVRVTEAVWKDLRQNISERLAFALTPTLRFHQKLTRTVARGLTLNGSRRNDITLFASFAEFPDLLDTATRLISSWVVAQLELFNRLFVDTELLSTAFFSGKRPLRVVLIHAGLSDSHDGGKTVTMIQFAEGLRVIYKPRPCDGELFWFEALRWLDRNGLHVGFRVPTILARKEYCWMEFLRTKDCKNAKEVRRFYFRWGVQAALAEILGAMDLHRDNWLAVGSQPILVDAELIGHVAKHCSDRHLPAVLRTGLLPIIARDCAGFYRGIAPFDEAVSQKASGNCWPRCRGRIQKPSRHVEGVVAGFQAVTELLSSIQVQKDFFKEIVSRSPRNPRVLQRATVEYIRLLRQSLTPSNMLMADRRRRFLVRECRSTALNRAIAGAEARSLLRCDIPKFTTASQRQVGSWQKFSAAIRELRHSSRFLRRRVLLGAARR